MSSVCGPNSEFTMLYAWALDAEGFTMPEGITERERQRKIQRKREKEREREW